jgi:hypothetical protein
MFPHCCRSERRPRAHHGTYRDVTLLALGATPGSVNTAATFNGTTSSVELPAGALKKSRDAAVEVWFKADTAGPGGPLIGYQDKALGTAASKGVPLRPRTCPPSWWL